MFPWQLGLVVFVFTVQSRILGVSVGSYYLAVYSNVMVFTAVAGRAFHT